MRASALLLSILLWSLPVCVAAKTETAWNFLEGIPGQWNITGCTSAEHTAEGFLVYTYETDCVIRRGTGISHPIDTLAITYLSHHPTSATFIWHGKGLPPTHMVELPILLEKADEPKTLELNLARFPQWYPDTERIGFVFHKNSAVVFQSIRFTQWSFFERFGSALLSLFTFDAFRPYSINFLWGPLIGFSPVWQRQLFASLPPSGWSVTRFLYLLLAFIAFFFFLQKQRRVISPRSALQRFAIVFATFWVLFDLRMGTEILSYAATDWRTFILQEPSKQQFRLFDNFYTVALESVPTLKASSRYGFAGPPGTPFGSIMRYLTYPSLPVYPETPKEQRMKLQSWLAFRRLDVSINDRGEIVSIFAPEEPITAPGSITRQFDDTSFLFSSPPSSS